jgi:hypothetical protein
MAVRRTKRRRLNLPVCVIVPKPEKLLFVSGRFRDLSETGVAVFAGVELSIDSEVQLEFTPPYHQEALRVRAVVRNRREYVYGLEFISLDRKEDENLRKLKEMLLPVGTEVGGSPDDRRWT